MCATELIGIICRFLDKTGRTGSTFQLINGIALLGTFFFVRLVWGGYIVRISQFPSFSSNSLIITVVQFPGHAVRYLRRVTLDVHRRVFRRECCTTMFELALVSDLFIVH